MRNLVVGVRGTLIKERFKLHFSALVNLIFLKYTVKLYQFKLRRMHELHVAIIDKHTLWLIKTDKQVSDRSSPEIHLLSRNICATI